MSNSVDDDGDFADWIILEAKAPFEDNEEALEALVNIKEIEFEGVFTDRDIQLDSDDDEGISISFYNEEVRNYLNLHIGDDESLHINLHLSEDNTNRTEQIMNELLEHSPSISVTSLTASRYFEIAFNSIDLPLEEESETDVVGLRIRRQGADFIIQEVDRETNSVHILMYEELDSTYAESFSDNFIDDRFEDIEAMVKEGL